MNGALIVTMHDLDKALKYNIIQNSKVSVFYILSNDNLDKQNPKVKNIFEKFKSEKLIVRENSGRDYGAFYFAWQKLKKDFDYIIFSHDDIVVHNDKWIDYFIEAFENKSAKIVSPCFCYNLNGNLIPRGAFWALKTDLDIFWPNPTSNQNAYDQEMNLLEEYVKTNTSVQIGNGSDLVTTPDYPPQRTECVFSFKKPAEFTFITK